MSLHTPNRMQARWKQAAEFIRREWPKITDVDIEEIDGEYDRLIHKIRELYRGGDEIQMEAKIKDTIQCFMNQLEASSQ